MISLFRKVPASAELLSSENNIYSALQNGPEKPQGPKLDLTSGNELSPEGKIFCARICTQNIPQEFKLPKTMQKVDRSQNEKSPDPIDFSISLANYQKMELEEAALSGVKLYLSETRQELQNKLFKEINRKRININCLRSEIRTLENRCKELSDAFPILK
jgi:hypothetical protein